MGEDPPAVIGDDSTGDGETQSSATSIATSCKEGFKQVKFDFVGHAASIVAYRHAHHVAFVGHFDLDQAKAAIFRKRVQRIGDEVENDLFDLLRTCPDHGIGDRFESDLAIAVLSQVLNHLHHILDEFGEVHRFLFLRLAHPRKIEQSLGDPFASEGLVLDSSKVGPKDFGIIGMVAFRGRSIRMQQIVQSRFKCFGAPCDRSERIVDFMRDAGCQKSNARQLFVANDFSRSLAYLIIEATLDAQKTLGPHVDGGSKFAQLVLAIDLDAVIESTRGHETRAMEQSFEWKDDRSTDVDAESDKQYCCEEKGTP